MTKSKALQKKKPAQQGASDGLCGVYSLVNFLARANCCPRLQKYEDCDGEAFTSRGEDAHRKIFRELVYAADQTGNLTAATIADGFSPHRLKETFFKFAERQNIQVQCRSLSEVVVEAQTEDIFKLASIFCGTKSAILAHMGDRDHWVLIYSGTEKEIWVDDSSDAPLSYRITKSSNTRHYGITAGAGFLLQITGS